MKKMCITSVCVALCCVLPAAFHAVGLGSAFSPMHIPVLLCGLVCGWSYGAFCGIVAPILSSILTSMPVTAQLIPMVPELCVYGLVSGLMMKWSPAGKFYGNVYLAMVPAMLLGRIAGGIARGIFLSASAQTYSVALWASGYLIQAVPGIVLHLLVVPALVMVLVKTRLLPASV